MPITKNQWQEAQQRALALVDQAGIVLTDQEKSNLEITDLGLENLDVLGLQIITYLNTDRCCAKELIMFSGQTCPEHRHPPVGSDPGKEETFRCRFGKVFIYVEGNPALHIQAIIPPGREDYFTAKHEIILNPGEQYTLKPDTLHWFQAGPGGAVVSEFSTKSRDEMDIFTDPGIKRTPEVV